jgi:hypothetical protein
VKKNLGYGSPVLGPLPKTCWGRQEAALGDLRCATRVKLGEQRRRPVFVFELRRGLRYATRDLAEGGPVFAYGSAEVSASLRDFWIDGLGDLGLGRI